MTYSYKDQLAVIGKVRVRDGQTFRGNCPFCGGRNTFTLTRKGTDRIWSCYRASCGVKGFTGEGDSIKGIVRRLDGTIDAKEFEPIPLLVPIEGKKPILAWLDSVHSIEAYKAGLIEIKYAPVEDRVMFSVADMGWTGRARKGVKPKWRKYGDTSPLLTVGTGRTAVLVEDACSACAVGVIDEYTGCSLLGTSLSTTHLMGLRAYDRVLVCLDPDATMKSLDMIRRIQGTVPASLRIIPDDLKSYNPEQIKEILDAS